MAVLQMSKICICGLKRERKEILEQIQRDGIVEICEENIEDSEAREEHSLYMKMDTQAGKSSFERNVALAENALDILNQYEPKKKGLFEVLKGRRRIPFHQFLDVEKHREEIITNSQKILKEKKEVDRIQTEIIQLEEQMEMVIPWLPMDVPGDTTGTARTSYLYGSIPESLSQEELYRKIEVSGMFPKNSDVRIFYRDKNQSCVAAFCMKQDSMEMEEALGNIGFSKATFSLHSEPQKELAKWKEKVKRLKKEKNAIENEIINMANYREHIENVADYFRSRAEKYDVLGKLYQTKNVFFIIGYIPKKEEEKFIEQLEKYFTVDVITEDISKEKEAPVALENNGFAKPVEGIVESFGLPKRGEIDPSAVMAVFYYILFGLMLSDAAYGFLIVVVCFVAIKKFPNMEVSMNKSLHMFLYCGISTMIWGILFGGYFGDVINVIASTFFHRDITVRALWFVPLEDPMKLLLYSMAIGIIHMFVGLGIKAYQLLKRGKIMDCLWDVGLWFLLLIGLILIIIPTDIFSSIAQKQIVFPSWLNAMAKGFAIVGVVGILLMSGRRKKNKWLLRIALGAYELYGVTGWLSDILSYSRLLALGLATGVIASVVNLMGTMLGDGPLGVALFIVVFLLGHTLNIGINLLGAYVHTSRLQYVEFFGKFYGGGGRAFRPFGLKTRHAVVEGDK